MELSHTFTVPASVEQTWATFMDLHLVGSCFPGATVTSVTEDGFAGTVKVKLGPIALVYAGTGTFVERDDGAHRAVIEAKGKDKRGNGTAGATVTIQLRDSGGGTTTADVQSDLAVTGKPAQFGRGVMQDVSDKLLGQFVACIEGKIGAPAPAPAPASTEPEPEAPPTQEPAAKGEDRTPAPAGNVARPVPATPAAARTPSPVREEEALDLGGTVLPVVLRSYGRQLAAAVAALLAVIVVARRLWRRSRR